MHPDHRYTHRERERELLFDVYMLCAVDLTLFRLCEKERSSLQTLKLQVVTCVFVHVPTHFARTCTVSVLILSLCDN